MFDKRMTLHNFPLMCQHGIARVNKLLEPIAGKELTRVKDVENQIICGDNLKVMLDLIEKGYVGMIDLIYIDPPYNSNRDYYCTDGEFAFTDKFVGGVLMYCRELYSRLLLMKMLLSEKGSIYIHVDWHVSHYVRMMMDDIFGADNFRNEIVWHYQTYQGQVKGYFPRKHDTLLLYSTSKTPIFNLLKDGNIENTVDFVRWNKYLTKDNEILANNYPIADSRFNGYIKRFVEKNGRKPIDNDVILKLEGMTVDSVWDIKAVDPKNKKEKTGYPTQKPEALLERIIKASSNEGSIVADFYAGSGTTGVVAKRLNRKYILCDVGEIAYKTMLERLKDERIKR